MATLVTVTVRSSGGDYTSLSAAESGEQTLRSDLVTRDEILRFDCAGFADTTQATVAGYTADSTRYLDIVGDHSGGGYSTSEYRLEKSTNDGTVLTVSVAYTRVRQIQVYHSASTNGDYNPTGIQITSGLSGAVRIERCLARMTPLTTQGRPRAVWLQSQAFLSNVVAWDALGTATTAGGIYRTGGGGSRAYFCTAEGCGSGYFTDDDGQSAANQLVVINCAAAACTDGFLAGWVWGTGSDYNASDIASDAPGANSHNGVTYGTWVDASIGHFQPPSTDTVLHAEGTDLSADATYPVSVDIEGTTRPATPSIGAWERAGGGAYEINAEPGSYAVTGSAATLLHHRLLSADPGSYAVTGAEAILARGRFLVADPGAYAVTGAEATLIYTPAGAYELTCEAGTYAITGADAMLLVGRALSADPGAYSVTGTDAALLAGRVLHAEPGSYTLTGSEAALLVGRVLAALAGDYALTGADATLTYTPATGAYELVCAPGSYAVTGADASLVMGRVLAAAPGVYTVTGSDAATLVGRVLEAAPGSYLVTGAEAAFLYHRALAADPGAYAVSGLDAGLTWSGETPEPTPDTRVWVIRDATRTWVIRDATRTWIA